MISERQRNCESVDKNEECRKEIEIKGIFIVTQKLYQFCIKTNGIGVYQGSC